MYRLIYQKPAHFLSTQMALLSPFFQMFIVLGMYNFAPYLTLTLRIWQALKGNLFVWFSGSRNSFAIQLNQKNEYIFFHLFYSVHLSIDNWVPHSGMLLYLHDRNSKLFFHPAKFDIFKDQKISDYKTVSVSQSKNLLDLLI